jgi:diadenosine tetraphosphate (Ap4A) HIT family hydrolase
MHKNVALGCEICSELAGAPSRFSRIYAGVLACRITWLHSEYALMPSLGQLFPGHLLLVPKWHCTSFAEAYRDRASQVVPFITRVREIVRSHYGEPFVFEHGVTPGAGETCGVFHAHTHFLPVLNPELVIERLLSVLPSTLCASWEDAMSSMAQQAAYLYFSSDASHHWVAPNPHIPSQYVRKIIAETHAISEWDWRQAGWESELLLTHSAVQGYDVGK